MKCYYNLYVSEALDSQKERILRKIKEHKWQFEKYLIALAKRERNHLEIYNSVLLIQKTISQEDIFLVGLADSYENALELVEKITQEVYDKTKGTDIRNYILSSQEEFEKGNVLV